MAFVCWVLKTSFTLEVPAFLPTLDSSRFFFLCFTGIFIVFSRMIDVKMEPVFPKAELALFLTVKTVAGRFHHPARAKVDEGTSCRI